MFIYGFGKNEKENVSADDLEQLRRAAKEALGWSDETIKDLIADDKGMEVFCK